jgi:hypothetical protein
MPFFVRRYQGFKNPHYTESHRLWRDKVLTKNKSLHLQFPEDHYRFLEALTDDPLELNDPPNRPFPVGA